ncbi:MAG: hypothetical protein K2W78_04930 [Xanthobacteraceae bacterium]|nr:hypothetical protein [Xanthobacteraceae bacterium]
MTTVTDIVKHEKGFAVSLGPAWLWAGVGVYLLLMMNGSRLLGDSDTFWQIAAGQWILDHRAWPSTDIYSFTKYGEPWLSSSWLAQVTFAGAYRLTGWTGIVALAAGSAAISIALLVSILSRRIPSTYAVSTALVAFSLSASHVLARPHIIALPVMMIWTHGLLSAVERRKTPSFWLLPIITLWANLHGGFVFGIVLVCAFAFEAWWAAERPAKPKLALHWALFLILTLVACCITPYGWSSLVAAGKILSLGDLLRIISEWAPVDFSHGSLFLVLLLSMFAAVFHTGFQLTLPRALIVTGLLFMALSHIRNIEIFAFLAPMIVAVPLARHFNLNPDSAYPSVRVLPLICALAVAGVATCALAIGRGYSPPAEQSPEAAISALQSAGAARTLNDLPFGGYMIWRGIPVFIDGRAELYGEKFGLTYYHALQLKSVDGFLDLLKAYRIDSALLAPSTPAAELLDHLDGWKRIYRDTNAVAFVRVATNP